MNSKLIVMMLGCLFLVASEGLAAQVKPRGTPSKPAVSPLNEALILLQDDATTTFLKDKMAGNWYEGWIEVSDVTEEIYGDGGHYEPIFQGVQIEDRVPSILWKPREDYYFHFLTSDREMVKELGRRDKVKIRTQFKRHLHAVQRYWNAADKQYFYFWFINTTVIQVEKAKTVEAGHKE